MRRLLATVVASAALTACTSQQSPEPATSGLPQDVTAIMDSPPYAGSTWALRVTDASTGEVLLDQNGPVLLEPASVTKTLSVGAAWLTFGPDSRITTPVVRDGRVRGDTLDGNLILVAKGDILMGGQTGPDGKVVFTNMDHNDANVLPGATIADNNPLAGLDDLAAQVRDAGIRRIAGDVIIDDRLFRTEDLGLNDGPVSPIVINNNVIDLVTSPSTEGEPADVRMRPKVAPWRVVNRVTTVAVGQDSDVALTSPRYGVIRLTGTIAADSDPIVRVEHFTDPPRFARTAFIQALQRAGVQVAGSPTRPNPAALLPSRATVAGLPETAALEGLSFEQNATYILKVSYNRGAQTQVCLLAAKAGSRSCDAGFPQMATAFSEAGIDPTGAALIDGSGLPGNYATAQMITELMQVFHSRPDYPAWQQALPIMGVDGSVAQVQKGSPAAGKVFAKTGTLGDQDLLNGRLRLATKALGGYIDSKSGRTLAIAIVVNQAMFDDIQGVFAANEDLGKIATALYEQY
jgi:D-alanyl-D-alanine carboxypeptidase/D-alanyl-D-alanine-endopeptidase (penicillin-binding protein 4)